MKPRTPAKRMHALAARHGLDIDEFSPGLRVWTIRNAEAGPGSEPLAFGVPHASLEHTITQLALERMNP